MLANKDEIRDVYLGDAVADKIYYGDTLIWQRETTYEKGYFVGEFLDSTDSDNPPELYADSMYFEIPYSLSTKRFNYNPGIFKQFILPKQDLKHIHHMFDVSEVESFNSAFNGCYYLETLNLRDFKTPKANDMYWMFAHCSKLPSLKLTDLCTSNVTTMNMMFGHCESLTKLIIRNFDTHNVNAMISMFEKCVSLQKIDRNQFDTSSLVWMQRMFLGCEAITEINLTDFDTKNVTDMSALFSGCTSLPNIDLSNFNTSSVTNMSNMFSSCTSLKELDLSSFDTSKATKIDYMFSDCSVLTKLTFGNLDFGNISYTDSIQHIFHNCSSLTTVNGVIKNINHYLNLQTVPLSNESAMLFINALSTASPNLLHLSKVTYNSLSKEQLAIATAKGWSVSAV